MDSLEIELLDNEHIQIRDHVTKMKGWLKRVLKITSKMSSYSKKIRGDLREGAA